jgi:hypothetical protein
MSQEVTLTSEMRARIIDKITRVLFHSHNHSDKRQPFESPGRVNFACPYCGDSHDNPRKKRGNLYWADLFFHCYNCSAHKSLDTFLGDFNQSFEGDERINVLNYIRENHKSFSLGENLDFYLFDKIKGMALTFEEIALAFNVYAINELTYRAYPYLKSRLLHLKLNRFAYDPRRKELYVFNLTSDDKIVGFQVRALEQTSGVKYKTWNMQRIYDRMNRDLNLPEEEVDPINKISMLFGILQADLGRDFTVFEGPIDAMFMNNSIGLTGVKKQIVEFDEIPTTRYFFDNDIEGKTKMIEKLKKNQRVFMWSKFLKDFHIPSKKVKDLNDLIQYEYKERTGCLNRLEQYFTSNQLDMIFL